MIVDNLINDRISFSSFQDSCSRQTVCFQCSWLERLSLPESSSKLRSDFLLTTNYHRPHCWIHFMYFWLTYSTVWTSCLSYLQITATLSILPQLFHKNIYFTTVELGVSHQIRITNLLWVLPATFHARMSSHFLKHSSLFKLFSSALTTAKLRLHFLYFLSILH